MTKAELISYINMALMYNPIVPDIPRYISYVVNDKKLTLGSSWIKICETYIDSPRKDWVVHVGFNTKVSVLTDTTFVIEIDGVRVPREYSTNTSTINFTEMLELSSGLHNVAVYAKAESTVFIPAREAKLGVYL